MFWETISILLRGLLALYPRHKTNDQRCDARTLRGPTAPDTRCAQVPNVCTQSVTESRIADFLAAKAPEASTLRTADNLDDEPVLSLKRLLALDSLDIDLIEPYGKPYWLFDSMK